MVEYLGFLILSLVAPLAPPRVAYWLCDRIGDLTFRLLARRRRNVERNLAVVLDGRRGNPGPLAREVFREGVRYYYDTFRVPALSDREFERLVSVDGWHHLEAAMARGKGAIIFTGHLGSPALVSHIIAVRGFKLTSVAEPVKPRRLFDLMCRVRGSRRVTYIPLEHGSTQKLVEALRRNEVLGMVVDRDVQKTGVPVELFGRGTTLPAGPATLALRTGAALMPACCWRTAGGTFAGTIGEPLELERTRDVRRDVEANTRRMARVLEEAISMHPEQWVVFEPIWPEEKAGAGLGVAS